MTNSECRKRRGTGRGGDKRERWRQRAVTVCVCVLHADAEGANFPTYIKLYSTVSDPANLHYILIVSSLLSSD